MKKIVAVIIILLGLYVTGVSQKPRIKFEKLSVEQGLSQSTIIDILRDSRGFMWFSTLDGLNKYDGYSVKVYWNSPTRKNALSDNITQVLYETPNTDNPVFWVGTAAKGLCKYNRIEDNFTTYQYSSSNKNSISNNRITAIAGDNDLLWVGTHRGLNIMNPQTEEFSLCDLNLFTSDTITALLELGNDIWVGTENGLTIFNPAENTSKKLYLQDGLPGEHITDIIQDNRGKVWISAENGIAVINPKTLEIENLTPKLVNRLGINPPAVSSVLQDIDSSFWIATQNYGLIKYIRETGEVFRYTHNPLYRNSLSINTVISLYRDNTNILWVGTSLGGVNKWNRAAEDLTVFRHNPYDENSLSASQVRSIYTDRENNVWVGTVEGGLNKWEKKNNRFKHFKHRAGDPKSLSHNHVRAICETKSGDFWVGTYGGGLNLLNRKTGNFKVYRHSKNNPKSIASDKVWDIIEDKDGKLWVTTYGGGLNLFNPEDETFMHYRYKGEDRRSLSNDLATVIFQDSRDFIWIGTFSGLNRIYPEERKFLRFMHEENNRNSLINNRIYSIHEDSEGYLWIGTKGGLNRFDVDNGKFEHLTTDNSDLPNNVILGILEEGEFIWVSTNRGIARINKSNFKIKNFNMGDGLQNNEFLAGSYCKADDGEMFFGGIDGFNAFYPKKVKDNPYKPPVVITEFKISNKSLKTDSAISEKKIIRLEHFENDISFTFVALDFIFPTENRYAFKLEPYDQEWNYVGVRRFASYTNLEPGNYTFKVKGSNNDEIWNEIGTSIDIYIRPAFWQTLWFKILSGVVILLAVFAVYSIRVRNIKRRNKELEETVKIRTFEIRQQNEEITAQNDEIQLQNDKIVKQHEEITDSIRYAERIQQAALSGMEEITGAFPEYFIFFRPRDIVSGDFFWAGKQNGKIVITAADCTGHGVPGAFMSMLGISFLNKIVNEKKITDAAEILNRLRSNIISALHQRGDKHESKDGMDMALITIDEKNKTIQFAGAFNPLVIVRNKEAVPYKAERMPVAIYDSMEPFKNTELNYRSGDHAYMFSDGFPDQFGGPRDKKFMGKRFRETLASISDLPMEKQKDKLAEVYDNWKGSGMQVDDVVVIGVKID
ncbi:MAG: two-component regulator propeller domain-containing protein [Bacteroidota bacterium]|nr:two-component regulator propeller domain-containing protein [Bacteroidota bacterium]